MKKWFLSLPLSNCILCETRCRSMLCTSCQMKLPWRHNPCWQCSRDLPNSKSNICGACLTKPPPWDWFISPWHFTEAIPQLIHRLKFSYCPQLARYLGKLAAPYIQGFYDMDPTDLIVPVPLHRLRQTRRLYNQSEWIARGLTSIIPCSLNTHCLKRIKYTRAQAKLSTPAERTVNIRAAFRAVKPPLAGHIALVDDVSTTGATAKACIQAWQNTSPARFSVWCLAGGDGKRYP